VTGSDNWSWTAYGFVDTYFDGENNNESALHYEASNQDPLSAGIYPLDRPVWDPREYFLKIFACRMRQVKEEWSNIVSHSVEQCNNCVGTLFSTSLIPNNFC